MPHKVMKGDESMAADYVSGMSLPDVARKHATSISKARLKVLRCGVKLRSRADGIRVAGAKISARLRGGVRFFSEDHRRALSKARLAMPCAGKTAKTGSYVTITTGPNKYRGEHCVVMESVIGRKLISGEVVHHKDENKHNNRPDNLEVLTRADHARLHINQRNAES